MKARLAAAAALLLAATALWGWSQWEKRLATPYRSYPGQQRLVLVPRGSSGAEIARILEDEGVVESARLFRWHLRLSVDTPLKAGEYLFDEPLSVRQVAAKLAKGDVHLRRITVPEGLDAAEVVQLLAREGFGDAERLRQAAADPAPIADLDPDADNLEGYLFPETYHFAREATEREVIGAMVANFRRVWTPERRRRASDLGLTTREAVTLASLIEKEASLAEERPLVSAVFHNRLRLNMNLASDPTVVYAVKRIKVYDGVIHRSDLELDSPYNTYLYPGLPPGPIANPGLASLNAALNPSESDYLYFVSRNDGSHVFSSNYRDHQRAVQRYQR